MTQRYSHLTTEALVDAIRLLDADAAALRDGDIVETADSA
jgi:hypothetical protein